MKKVSPADYERTRRWVYLHARHLELTKWQYFFEDGNRESVVEALSFYQNEDGGFGHGLDCDCLNPNSSPLQTLTAYSTLKEIGCDDADHPMIRGMVKYLENCEYVTERGCCWSIPSNNRFPCASWYLFPNDPAFPPGWPPENYCNGLLVEFALRYCEKGSDFYAKVLRVIEYRISTLSNLATFLSIVKSDIGQSIETGDWVHCIRCLKEHGLKTRDECETLLSTVLKIVETSANPAVYQKVEALIQRPGVIEPSELDAMVDDVSENKIWCENGLLCDDPGKKLSEIATLGGIWWPISGAIHDLKILKDHHRLTDKEK